MNRGENDNPRPRNMFIVIRWIDGTKGSEKPQKKRGALGLGGKR